MKLLFVTESWRDILDTTLCDNVYQWLVAGWWFSPSTPVSSSNQTDRHDITEILLKVALDIITLTLFADQLQNNPERRFSLNWPTGDEWYVRYIGVVIGKSADVFLNKFKEQNELWGGNKFLYRGIKYNIFGLIPKTKFSYVKH